MSAIKGVDCALDKLSLQSLGDSLGQLEEDLSYAELRTLAKTMNFLGELQGQLGIPYT